MKHSTGSVPAALRSVSKFCMHCRNGRVFSLGVFAPRTIPWPASTSARSHHFLRARRLVCIRSSRRSWLFHRLHSRFTPDLCAAAFSQTRPLESLPRADFCSRFRPRRRKIAGQLTLLLGAGIPRGRVFPRSR